VFAPHHGAYLVKQFWCWCGHERAYVYKDKDIDTIATAQWVKKAPFDTKRCALDTACLMPYNGFSRDGRQWMRSIIPE
jgi:hypothetical protein